jgi:3-deoxy-7-phosphoheptulonate synthase
MINKLPSPNEIKSLFSITSSDTAFINYSRNILKKHLFEKKDKIVVFCGPCSIHDQKATIEYAKKLKLLSEKHKNSNLIFIMRFYYEKARTKTGWKGFLYDPDIDGTNSFIKGLIETRKLLVEITKLKVPVCTEFLDPIFSTYFEDLITFGFIGARTVSSQIHRQLVSSFPFPVGFKNNIDGNIDTAVCACVAAREKHHFPKINNFGNLEIFKSSGNPHTSIVLRGAKTFSNFDEKFIISTKEKQKNHNLDLPVIVDCSHGNSKNIFENQIQSFNYLKNLISRSHTSRSHLVNGIMLESNLISGNQKISKNLEYGKSITDSCIDFETTEKLVEDLVR